MSKNGDEHIPQEDNFASKSDILCNASPGTLGERNINGENASASVKLKGTDKANSDSVTELIPRQESQDGAITRLATSSICMVPEEVKAQKHCKETDACSKAEREEGEFFPNINLEENDFSASGNNDTKLTQTHCKSDPNTREIGGEQMSIVEAGEQNDAIDDDEAEGSTHGSSDSEHASENGDVSVSDSANG